ncbi:FAD-containing oxidoreductase [Aquimarina sp. 2304DJ70-9]|uniref:FAD-containing oxidoreductase n=1 Tax=Aquimarina penaris TaxID=3231044 RepID=UPI003462C731
MKTYDSIIIGAGQAGPSLAATLASKGEKVALVERKWLGGTCVNEGCTPTKTMIASARVAHVLKRAAEYGIMSNGDFIVDMKKVKARKDAIVKKSNTKLENWLNGIPNVTIYRYHARFLDNHTLKVGENVLTAPKIFINTGARARLLEGAQEALYFTSRDILNVDFVPEHLIIVGGSYIGLEFAQMYRRFGSEVTVIEMGPRLILREDPDTSLEVQNILEKEGIKFRFNAECIRITKKGKEIVVNVECDEGSPTVIGSHALVAIGRVPNTEDLGVENTSLLLDQRGYIKVNDVLKTNVEGIWALGDVNGRGAFTHTSYNDFEVVADQLTGEKKRSITDRILCYALYTDPPLGRVGMTVAQALQKGHNILKGYRPFSKIARAVEKGEDQGFMQVIVDADTKEILGATILGIGADEIVHLLLNAIRTHIPYTIIKETVHIHPTVSELIPTMLGELKLHNNKHS